ncbi:hypothetical protein EDC63_10614 [Sulfurirhabdus autotrophica]|uniref:Uncharacterized protein n=1 Tax=Sulfurirhabdus autotrophica TaxID=1706046 RepID=A0A4R3Y8L8_9PROT|nr:hypothetical protein EDC63_10614 [Sulfurirhabdus autotrophica]
MPVEEIQQNELFFFHLTVEHELSESNKQQLTCNVLSPGQRLTGIYGKFLTGINKPVCPHPGFQFLLPPPHP